MQLSRTHNIIRIGAHVNISKFSLAEGKNDIPAIFDYLAKSKANCFQFFTKNLIKKTDAIKKINQIKTLSIKYNILPVIHASYKINLANDYVGESWWIQSLIQDLRIAERINAIGCVLHMGKYLKLPRNLALSNMRQALIYVLKNTEKSKILLETPSGAGTEMCYKISTLAKFIKSIPKKYQPRIGVCIDTCHIFSAGYEIRNRDAIKEYLERFDKKIGLNKIMLLHLNDSKTDKKSHVDRHESLGKGHIGLTGLIQMARNMMKQNVPIILETPENSYKSEIKMLWSQSLKI